jgi:drug/metabolite transporter (DMT)-like permease
MEAGKASILATVEPLVATIVGVALFNETLTAVKVIGMAMIFVAIVLLNVNNK